MKSFLPLLFIAGSCSHFIACRSNPFGNTPKPNEEFRIYLADFATGTDGGMKAALIDVINNSSQTLDCAFSDLTQAEIVNALDARARAGIQVRLAFDADASKNGPAALEDSGLFEVALSPVSHKRSQLLYGNRGEGAVRHNFCVADERLVYISTAAPDDTQTQKMPQVALKIGGAPFGLPGEMRREMNLFSQLVFGSGKAKTDFAGKFSALGQEISLYWGPQEDPMNVLGSALADATHRLDFYATGYRTTNPGKATLDVPQVMTRLASAKGLPTRAIFTAPALKDEETQAFAVRAPLRYSNPHTMPGANIFLIDRGLPSARVFIYAGLIRSQANTVDDSVLIALSGTYATGLLGDYLDKVAEASAAISNVGDISSPGAVVINEMQWMGTYSNSLVSDGSDEFIELYNTTDAAINLSGWKFSCRSSNGATINSAFSMPAATVIAAKSFLVIAANSSAAFPRADLYASGLGITNDSSECHLANVHDTLIDAAGDGFHGFDTTAAMGTNDTLNKIRRSMERIDAMAAGNNTTNWRPNSYAVATNSMMPAEYSSHTFASPGATNSAALTIALPDYSFEFGASWSSITAGNLIFDGAVGAQSGTKTAHYSSLTSSISGREFQSECLSALPLTNYTASIYEYAPTSNVSFVSASLKLWWYADAACSSPISQSTQSQSSVSPQDNWNRRIYSQTSPAGTQSLRLSVRARYATSAECSGCANSSDLVYFDSAAITSP